MPAALSRAKTITARIPKLSKAERLYDGVVLVLQTISIS